MFSNERPDEVLILSKSGNTYQAIGGKPISFSVYYEYFSNDANPDLRVEICLKYESSKCVEKIIGEFLEANSNG